MLFFTLELRHIKQILEALRGIPDSPLKAETLCWFKQQIAGKIRKLDPFMREQKWIEQEIAYENKSPKNANCTDCKKPCRTKYCADCWKQILVCFHNVEGHSDHCKSEKGK